MRRGVACAAIAALVGVAWLLRPHERPSPSVTPWTPHSSLRGIGLPPKNPLSPSDYAALDVLQPGSMVLFSAQLGDRDPLRRLGADPQLQGWLAVRSDVLQVVRMWPVRGPEDPRHLAQRIASLHHRFPWIRWFQIANEPDVEWVNPSWPSIAAWTEDVWWQFEALRRRSPDLSDVRLLFPPLAQDSRLDPEHVGYDELRAAIELYLDHGDGLAGHEYWDRGNVYLVEDSWPDWLRARLTSMPFFVTECGRRPGPQNGPPDAALGDELIEFAHRTRASVVAPFVLSSPNSSFDQFDFVDRDGQLRPQLFAWGRFGP